MAAEFDILYRWFCRWTERSGGNVTAVLIAFVPGGDFGLCVHPKRRTLSEDVPARGFGWTSLVKGA